MLKKYFPALIRTENVLYTAFDILLAVNLLQIS